MATTAWKGDLLVADVRFPVKIITGAREINPSFRQLDPEGRPVKNSSSCARDEMRSGLEIEKGRFVTVTPKELESVAAPPCELLRVAGYAPIAEVEAMRIQASYYLWPGAEEAEVSFGALRRTLLQCGVAACLDGISLYGRRRDAVILAGSQGLQVFTLLYQREMRSTEEFRVRASIPPKEIARFTLDVRTHRSGVPANADAQYYAFELLRLTKQSAAKSKRGALPKPAPAVSLKNAGAK